MNNGTFRKGFQEAPIHKLFLQACVRETPQTDGEKTLRYDWVTVTPFYQKAMHMIDNPWWILISSPPVPGNNRKKKYVLDICLQFLLK